jgi:glycosyltransferase involved in cell wall biosynthesis
MMAHGRACERCFGGRHWKALATGCVQGSTLKSAVGMVEAYVHDAINAYGSVKRWIAPSDFVREKALRVGLRSEQIRVLRHGVEALESGASNAAIPTERYVFFSGRLSLEKGVKLLPAVAATIGDTPLLVAGDGPLRFELEQAAQSQPNLRLLGHLSDADLAAYRAGAAVVVIPSLFYEHFCYAAGEAMLDARPMVASRIGAIPELVEHEVTGLLVSPGDVAELAEAVRRALADPPAARAWGEEGKRRILEGSNPKAHVGRLVEIYLEAME